MRVASDIGGTFTAPVAFDEETGELSLARETMRFNKFIWSLFCNSKAGRAAISRYESLLARDERWVELAPKGWMDKLRPLDPMAAQAVFDQAVARRVAPQDHAGELYERLLGEGFTLSLEIEDGETIYTVVGDDELEAWLNMIQGISAAASGCTRTTRSAPC